MEHCRPRVNTTSLIVLETITSETWRQPIKVIIIQSFDVNITTTKVETVVVPNMDVVKMGIIIGFVTN